WNAPTKKIPRTHPPTDTSYGLDYKSVSGAIHTSHHGIGLSQPLVAQDGIDQGEVISPLLWRIFYDPLLSRIQSDPRLGYTMSSSWRTSIYSDKIATMELRCACLAYADDTIWIGKNKQDLERIIEISNEFFDLNDIAINGK